MDFRNYNFWDWLAWAAFAYFFVYLLLKVLGILHSLPLADILAISSIAFYVGKYAQKIDRVTADVEHLKSAFEKHIVDKEVHR